MPSPLNSLLKTNLRSQTMNKVPPPLEPLLTLKEVAVALDASIKTVRRRIDAGELPVVRDGRLIRVRPPDLRTYIAARIRA